MMMKKWERWRCNKMKIHDQDNGPYLIILKIKAHYASFILAPEEGLWPLATKGALQAPIEAH